MGRAGTLFLILFFFSCNQKDQQQPAQIFHPDISTVDVAHVSGHPAIWIHPDDPAKSKIVGSDYYPSGSLYLFDLSGQLVKATLGLQKPYSVDVEYNFLRNNKKIDLAATVESTLGTLRLFVLPQLHPIDDGGIKVLKPDGNRGDVAVALYRRRPDGAFFAVIGAPAKQEQPGCLSIYRLQAGESKKVSAFFAAQFGTLINKGEVPAIAIDDELGYIYYLDPDAGIRKIVADPDRIDAGEEKALFGGDQLLSSRGSIAIYKVHDGTGYILVADPVSSRLLVYPREGTEENPHQHELIGTLGLNQGRSGCEVTNVALNPQFPAGLLVSPTPEGSYNYYSWEKLAGDDLVKAPDGRPILN